MDREERRPSLTATTTWYVLAATTAAAAVGALLGAAGSLGSVELRVATATLLALAAVVPGALELAGRRCTLAQRDRETPRRWLLHRPWRWAVLNGGALGVGAGSRIGFPAWYAIPAACLLFGSAPGGAALYGIYGFTRALAVLPILIASGSTRHIDVSNWLLGRRRLAHRVLGANLLGISLAVIVGVGI